MSYQRISCRQFRDILRHIQYLRSWKSSLLKPLVACPGKSRTTQLVYTAMKECPDRKDRCMDISYHRKNCSKCYIPWSWRHWRSSAWHSSDKKCFRCIKIFFLILVSKSSSNNTMIPKKYKRITFLPFWLYFFTNRCKSLWVYLIFDIFPRKRLCRWHPAIVRVLWVCPTNNCNLYSTFPNTGHLAGVIKMLTDAIYLLHVQAGHVGNSHNTLYDCSYTSKGRRHEI